MNRLEVGLSGDVGIVVLATNISLAIYRWIRYASILTLM